MTHIPTIGSRIQVYRGHAKKTSGGLTRSDLMMNKHGRVVSKAKHFTAKKEMRLLKHGYGTKKGKFGYVKVGSKGRKSRSRKMKGGNINHSLSPLDLNESSGAGITDFGVGSTDVQMRAAMAGGSGLKPLVSYGSAGWGGDNADGTGMTDFGNISMGSQLGGRRRLRRRSMAQRMALGKSRSRGFALRSKGVAMRGGTTSLRSQIVPADASSVGVQLRAGSGN